MLDWAAAADSCPRASYHPVAPCSARNQITWGPLICGSSSELFMIPPLLLAMERGYGCGVGLVQGAVPMGFAAYGRSEKLGSLLDFELFRSELRRPAHTSETLAAFCRRTCRSL